MAYGNIKPTCIFALCVDGRIVWSLLHLEDLEANKMLVDLGLPVNKDEIGTEFEIFLMTIDNKIKVI